MIYGTLHISIYICMNRCLVKRLSNCRQERLDYLPDAVKVSL